MPDEKKDRNTPEGTHELTRAAQLVNEALGIPNLDTTDDEDTPACPTCPSTPTPPGPTPAPPTVLEAMTTSPFMRPSDAYEILTDAIKEFHGDIEAYVYHADSDGLFSALTLESNAKDVPELLSTRWHARKEYEEEEVATVDFLTPHHPGLDHKRPAPEIHREDHVIVLTNSMCEALGPRGQTYAWATSDTLGRGTPYDAIAAAEFMHTTRGTFEDILPRLAEGTVYSEAEARHLIEERLDPHELPSPRYQILMLPGGTQVAVMDYGVDEAVALAPISIADIILGKKYAYIGNPLALSTELRVTIERIHERRTIKSRLKKAKKMPTLTLPTAGISLLPG